MTGLRWFLLILIVLGLGAGGFHYWSNTATRSKSELVQQAAPKEILDYVRSLNSPLVLINFWASWCEPCKVEFPHLMQLQKEYAPHGLKVVFVSVDDPADIHAAEAFLKQQQVGPPTFYKGDQSLSFVAQLFPKWSGAVPATILLGPDLQILDGWEGDTSLEEFQQRVKKHLKGS